MRYLAAALAMLAFAGCTPHRKPPVVVPTPPPIAEQGVPPKGTPVAPERLLRQANACLTNGVQIFGAMPCCDQFKVGGKPVNSRWPLGSCEWMDYTASFGANAWGFRFYPWLGDADHESEWADIGGPVKADGSWNDAFWTEARRLAFHAHELGGYVEASNDLWYCKAAKLGWQPLNWSDEDTAACGVRPSPGQERMLRKMVEELGCFGWVIWSVDVEGDQVPGWKPEWFTWARGILRDEEQRSGCGFVHMIGTNNPSVAYLGFDYAATHARAPLREPIAGLWTINNERNPAFSPEQETANFVEARSKGLAWWYWRAEMTDEQQEQTLGLFRDAIKGTVNVGCFAPDPDDERWKPSSGGPGDTLAWLEQAKAAVGDPKALPGATVWDRGLEALRRLGVEVRAQGHCASGPWRDALVIQSGTKWVELHPVAFTDGGWTGDPFKGSVWSY